MSERTEFLALFDAVQDLNMMASEIFGHLPQGLPLTHKGIFEGLVSVEFRTNGFAPLIEFAGWPVLTEDEKPNEDDPDSGPIETPGEFIRRRVIEICEVLAEFGAALKKAPPTYDELARVNEGLLPNEVEVQVVLDLVKIFDEESAGYRSFIPKQGSVGKIAEMQGEYYVVEFPLPVTDAKGRTFLPDGDRDTISALLRPGEVREILHVTQGGQLVLAIPDGAKAQVDDQSLIFNTGFSSAHHGDVGIVLGRDPNGHYTFQYSCGLGTFTYSLHPRQLKEVFDA